MREGELLALTLNDFDFDNNTVSITKNYARLGYEEIIQAPKTPKSKRTITLPVEIMEMVKEYSSMLYDYKPTDRLFIASKQSLAREMIRGCTASGVKRIRIHDLRHPYVKLKLKISSAYHCRIFGTKVLDFPLDFKPIIGIYTHLFDKHIGKCLC